MARRVTRSTGRHLCPRLRFYELLTGAAPFTVDFVPTTPQQMRNWLATMQQAHEQASMPPLPRAFPTEINDLIHCCLAKLTADRYATPTALLTDLTTLYQEHFDQSPPAWPAPDLFTAGDYSNRGNTYADLQDHTAALADFTRTLELYLCHRLFQSRCDPCGFGTP